MSDVYYKPEEHGLSILGSAELDLAYEFDMFVVWQADNGQLYYGSDCGCSCPSPFEDCYEANDLEKADSPQDVLKGLDDWVNDYDSKTRERAATSLRETLMKL